MVFQWVTTPAHIAAHEITARVASLAPAVATYTRTTRTDADIVAQGIMGKGVATTPLPISTCAASAAMCAFTAVPETGDEDVISTQPACMNFSAHEVFCQGVKEPAFG